MSNRELREDARAYFVPIILGSNSSAHKLSSKIFRKFGIHPIIADTKRSLPGIFDPFCYFVRLVPTNDIIIAEQLTDLACQMTQTQSILIPCSKEYNSFVDAHLVELEQIFIISQPENVFSLSPLAKVMN